ncbi:hypothetical protein L1887_56801 [Cichorium endivia]|nr:hypothetical protein L1887_56801 [Cichorium endivia]
MFGVSRRSVADLGAIYIAQTVAVETQVEKVSWLRELDDSLKATRTAVAANNNATVTRGAAKLNLERASLPAPMALDAFATERQRYIPHPLLTHAPPLSMSLSSSACQPLDQRPPSELNAPSIMFVLLCDAIPT